ncbi:MAG: hypothetical protein ACRECJ_08180 [Limisphaerales bacterium]
MSEQTDKEFFKELPPEFAKGKKLPQICYLCGIDLGSDFTVDHLPPQGIFPEKDEPFLLKVPACNKCHPTRQQSMDDEYFRNCMTEWVGKENMPVEVVENKKRALEKRPFQELDMLVNAKPILVQSKSGIVERRFEVKVQPHRITSVLERVGRGFHFYRYGKRVPSVIPNVYVNESSIYSTTRERDKLLYPAIPGFISVPEKLKVRHWNISGGILNESNWVFIFYEKVEFFVKFELFT